jgi:hypothetical protein
MRFRPATRPLAAAATLALTLAACSELYSERRDTLSLVSGESVAANRVAHMIDPWPRLSGKRNIAYNGEKAAAASERYRTGRVIRPGHASTSSVSYSQMQPTAPNGPASSAPNNTANR